MGNTVFDALTVDAATLGIFLRRLPVLDAPWDAEFQKRYCKKCVKVDCDACIYTEERNNPDWWLALDVGAANAERYNMKQQAIKKVEVYAAANKAGKRCIRVREEHKAAKDRYCLIAEFPLLGGRPVSEAWHMGMSIAREYVLSGHSAAAVVGIYKSTTTEPLDLEIVRVYEKWRAKE